jgi:hypothetical protein
VTRIVFVDDIAANLQPAQELAWPSSITLIQLEQFVSWIACSAFQICSSAAVMAVRTFSSTSRPALRAAATRRSPGAGLTQQPEQDDRGRVVPASTLHARWPSRSCSSAASSCSSTGVTAVARVHSPS